MRRVVLVGLGLMGGSIGAALRQRLPDLEIVGVDRETVVFSEHARQLLTQAAAIESPHDVAKLASDADLVVLAMPVGEIARQVTEWLRFGVPVTDCGSTKRVIVAAAQSSANRDWFVPGHPMAGRERGGLSRSDGDLFRGRRWIVCPQSVRDRARQATESLVTLLDAIWTEMTPDEHDAVVALTSHVPQILASWLAAAADEHILTAAGPAFSDMTRISGGSDAIWKDIFFTNGAAIADIMRALAADFTAIADQLGNMPPNLQRVLELLAAARNRRANPGGN
jgi:prephenate dehydrogenase